MIARAGIRRTAAALERPDRAVIDIGSNTVRLVVYAGSVRAPEVFLNEKVSARLGQDLSTTGMMPEAGMQAALTMLARAATILADLEIRDVQTVATAAVREARNGPEFMARVTELGLSPRLLTGEEEAQTSAMGVIGAFPRAVGTVADLGGGSLELVHIGEGRSHGGTSLPLGTLRLPALRDGGMEAFRSRVARIVSDAEGGGEATGRLYMVGGTWRAFAAYAMRAADHPLTDPHGYRLATDDADRYARIVEKCTSAELAKMKGISKTRAAVLPDAAAMLRVLLAELKPDSLIFSAWGLREGLLYGDLDAAACQQDPLLSAIGQFTEPRGASPSLAATITGWTADVASGAEVPEAGSERLRLAATMLAIAAARLEPNMRLRHALDWALEKRWLAIDPAGRARLAAALHGACGKPVIDADLLRLTTEDRLREAVGWGLAIRLCRRLGAGSHVSLMTSTLRREGGRLVLRVDPARAALAAGPVLGDLRNLAQWMGLEHELRIAEREDAIPA
ncbi:Ppx/GppA family phosphatase [Croceibacterium mercuriale]|uniref:Ppx/GppA family phosphatase n=1 Tax=Croceibacterium mercuriale TaxID=1572751 RepID=UPI00068A0E94|nr:Ppx/GppA family phosphatase [Croceibacterium mercuriale]